CPDPSCLCYPGNNRLPVAASIPSNAFPYPPPAAPPATSHKSVARISCTDLCTSPLPLLNSLRTIPTPPRTPCNRNICGTPVHPPSRRPGQFADDAPARIHAATALPSPTSAAPSSCRCSQNIARAFRPPAPQAGNTPSSATVPQNPESASPRT